MASWMDEPPLEETMKKQAALSSKSWMDEPPSSETLEKQKSLSMPELKPDSGLLSSGARALTGATVGVAEAMNPASLPRFAETVTRMPFQDVNKDQSLFGRLGERYKKADEASVIPEFNISQLAAGTRAAARAPFSDKNLSDVYKEEMANQKNFESDFLPPYSKAIGQGVAGAVSLGTGIKDLAAMTSLGKATRGAANTQAYNSLRPIGTAAQKMSKEGRIQPIGEQLLKEGIVTAGATYKNILERTQSKLKDYGEKIGYFAKAADEAAARDSSIRQIPFDDLANNIRSKVIAPLLEDPSSMSAGEDVAKWVSNLEKVHGGQDISYQKAQTMKGMLDKVKAKFKSGGDTISKDAYQEVYGIINEQMENGIGAAISKAAPTIQNDFKETKTAFRNLKDAERLIEKTVSKTANENNRFSLTDMIAGGVGATIGAPLGPLGAGAGGIAAGVANNLAKTRGSQAAASFLNAVGTKTDMSSIKRAMQAVGATNETKSLMDTILGGKKEAK